jgi:2-desacetyl-2-hydroxyethyl bacteriochlorophyllide A dehydrogenase
MRALVYAAPSRLIVEDYPRPNPAAGEVEIAVAAAGICGADVAGFLGRSRHRTPPLILGHELVGRTPQGQRVVVDPVIGCGRCAYCRSGQKNLCTNLRLLGMDPLPGCFAEFVAVPKAQVYEIPDVLDDWQAILAEPLANVVHVFRLAAPEPRFRMGIVGAGTMGSLALRMALHLGASQVLVEDVEEVRLAAARQMGATFVLNSETGSGEASESSWKGAQDGFDLVLDACGEDKARQRAFDLCRPGGTVALLGLAKARSEIDFGASIRKEHRALMSFGYTTADFRRSLDLLVAGEIDMKKWTAELPLEDGQAAFERVAGSRGDTLKMVLRVR